MNFFCTYILLIAISAAAETSKVEILNDGPKLQLNASMQKALVKYDSKFVIFDNAAFNPALRKYYKPSRQQLLSAVSGDFDGDRKGDIVLLGHNLKDTLILALVSDGKEHKVFEIKKNEFRDPKTLCSIGLVPQECGLNEFLVYRGPGKIKSHFEKQMKILNNDAFEISFFEKSSVLYFYEKGQFLTYITAD